MSTIYFDEAGYTGSDLTNEDQPFFVVGSTCFTDDELNRIKSDLNISETSELHFKKLIKSTAGRKLIIDVLSHPLMNTAHVKIGIADKRYCIYAQIVDTVIETFAYSHGVNIYENLSNLVMANCLYSFAVNHQNQEFVKDFENAFVQMIRKQDEDSIEEFYAATAILQSLPNTHDTFREALGLVSSTEATVTEAFTNDSFYLDITIPLFMDLVNRWHKETGELPDVKFDSSKPLIARGELITQLKNLNIAPIKIGPNGREHILPLPVGDFALVDSTAFFGVQIADIAASAAYFILTNKKAQLEPFKRQLMALPILTEASSSICPASAEFLEKVMNTPFHGSPIDIIASLLHNE